MMKQILVLLAVVSQTLAFAPVQHSTAPAFRRMDTRRYNFFDNIDSFITNWGRKVTASHILIGPKTLDEPEAKAKLLEIKEEIGDDPSTVNENFAEAAYKYSTCRGTRAKGGDLGTFGPGLMIKPIDLCCFNDDIGVVHGPISSVFGEHLVLIRDRTEKK